MRITSAAIALFFFAPGYAQLSISYPVSIPQECVDLAHRENVPVVIESKYQAAKALIKLSRMSDQDPLVLSIEQLLLAPAVLFRQTTSASSAHLHRSRLI